MTQTVATTPPSSSSPPRMLRIERMRLPAWSLVAALLFMVGMIGYPVAVLLLNSLVPGVMEGELEGVGEAYRRMLSTRGVPTMLWNSLRWGAATTAGAWLIGIPAGYLLARTNLRGKAIARLSLLVPIMTPPYIAAISYILVMQPGGFADGLVGRLPAAIRMTFFGFWGVTFVMTMASFGYVAIGIEAALRAIPERLDAAAASLGASLVQRMRFIIVPLLLPAILNTGLLVFLDALSNFGVPAILGSRANLPLLPAEIYYLVTSWPVDLPLATALSSLLLVVAVGSLLINQRLLRRFQTTTGRSSTTYERPLGPFAQAAAWTLLGLLFIFSVVIPYAAMLLTSFADRWGEGMPSLTLVHYGELFTPGSRGLGALLTSLGLSLTAATICVVMGGFTAYVIGRHRGALATAVDGMSLLPRVLPKIVMAVALIMAWNAPWVQVQIYGTIWILLIAYVALYFSDALRYGDTGMRQIAPRLEHAAAQLGAPSWRVFVLITLPMLRPALVAAWMTTFIVCMRDLVASVILLPPGVETTGSFIFNQFEQGDISAAMAMASVTIGLSTLVLLTVRLRLPGRGSSQPG